MLMYLDAAPSPARGAELRPGRSAFGAALVTLAVALAGRPSAPSESGIADDLTDVLRRLRDLVPGTRAASIVAERPAGCAPATVVATSPLAVAADAAQFAAGTGPTLAAREDPVCVGAEDLAHRWPDAASRLHELGVAAVLAAPMPGLGTHAALTLYADAPFPVDTGRLAGEAAAVASVALAALQTRERAANLEVALSTSRQIAAAVGIVMARDRCSYDEAFQRIRAVSQQTHRKMREIADAIVFTGALPDSGGSGAAHG